jgi:hypothetical protein
MFSSRRTAAGVVKAMTEQQKSFLYTLVASLKFNYLINGN